MSFYARALSALQESKEPHQADLEVLVTPDEPTKSLIVRDLHILLPRLLRFSISSENKGLRLQARRCLVPLKEAFLENDFANEELWKELHSYFLSTTRDEGSQFFKEMTDLIRRNDLGWKDCWSFVAVLIFTKSPNKISYIQCILKIAEFAFKTNLEEIVDLSYICWLEIIDLFSQNLTLLHPNKLIKLLIAPLKTSANTNNKMIKITGFMMILEKIASKFPEHSHPIVDALLNMMFLKENCLAKLHPNECLDTMISLSLNETVQNNSITKIAAVLFKCTEFDIDFAKYEQLVENLVNFMTFLDDKEHLEQSMTKLVKKLLDKKKFILSERIITKMSFLPQELANTMLENFVTKPVIDECEKVVDSSKAVSPVISPLASRSVFMHRLAKSNETNAKSCFAMFNEHTLPKASTSKDYDLLSEKDSPDNPLNEKVVQGKEEDQNSFSEDKNEDSSSADPEARNSFSEEKGEKAPAPLVDPGERNLFSEDNNEDSSSADPEAQNSFSEEKASTSLVDPKERNSFSEDKNKDSFSADPEAQNSFSEEKAPTPLVDPEERNSFSEDKNKDSSSSDPEARNSFSDDKEESLLVDPEQKIDGCDETQEENHCIDSTLNTTINTTCEDIDVSVCSDIKTSKDISPKCPVTIVIDSVESEEETTKSFITEEDLCVSGSTFEVDVTIDSLASEETIENQTSNSEKFEENMEVFESAKSKEEFDMEVLDTQTSIVESSNFESKSDVCSLKKRARDEISTPEHGVKRPRLENSPPSKITKMKEVITNYFKPVTTEIPKTFSFGSITITKVEKLEDKENSEPNVMTVDELNESEQPSLETTTRDIEMDCEESDTDVDAQIKSPQLKPTPLKVYHSSPSTQHLSRAASILRLAKYNSPRVKKKRTSIFKSSQNNWPSGSQENWIAHGPTESTPRRSSIRKHSMDSPEVSSPLNSKKKRVSFNDPPVTKGLLYDPVTNSGHVQHPQLFDNKMDSTNAEGENQVISSSDDDDDILIVRKPASSFLQMVEAQSNTSVIEMVEDAQSDAEPKVNDASTQIGCMVVKDADTQSRVDMNEAGTQSSDMIVKDATTQSRLEMNDIGIQNNADITDATTQSRILAFNDASTQSNDTTAKDATTQSAVTLNDASTQSNADVTIAKDATTQSIISTFDASTQSNIVITVNDASTQSSVDIPTEDDSTKAITQSNEIKIFNHSNGFLTHSVHPPEINDLRRLIEDVFSKCEIRLVPKD